MPPPKPAGVTTTDESAAVVPPHGRRNAAWLGSVPLPTRAKMSLSRASCEITQRTRARTGGVSVVTRNAGVRCWRPPESLQRTSYQYGEPATSDGSVSVHEYGVRFVVRAISA